ncbi:hypothetical protein I350_02934 [Cryptococcus amylolentus CBS 6273]|uniref:Uncharacterized protein n=1 Tax=Cryptococcus amylolentus CBS 6273 TaxID=1296118 RepID=A0A1E3K818_9TREE|nr:hypothetical protein I350_02934 [Cryptococcus amylolentus CBS 6273]
MDFHGHQVSLDPLPCDNIHSTPPPSNPGSDNDTYSLDGGPIAHEIPRSPEGMEEPWEERCQILMRENKLLKEICESWEDKCRAIESKQRYLAELSAICDAARLRDMKSELRNILDSIVREKEENMRALRELDRVRDDNLLESRKDIIPFPTSPHVSSELPPPSRGLSHRISNLLPARRHSMAPYNLERGRSRVARKVRSVTGTGPPPLGKRVSVEQRLTIENWRQKAGESEEVVMQTPTSLMRPLSPMSGDEWQEVMIAAVHPLDRIGIARTQSSNTDIGPLPAIEGVVLETRKVLPVKARPATKKYSSWLRRKVGK